MAKDTHMLEKVQHFGLWICMRHWNSSYQDLLDIFQLPSLTVRRSNCHKYYPIGPVMLSPVPKCDKFVTGEGGGGGGGGVMEGSSHFAYSQFTY